MKKGSRMSEQGKANISAALKGRPKSEEHRAKIKASWTPERKALQVAASRAIMLGKPMTEETRAKLAAYYRVCPHGHNKDIVGRTNSGGCLICYEEARIRKKNTFKYLEKYSITLEDYNRLFAKQNGLCPGCYIHFSQLKRRPDVEHSHITNKVRGLTCRECNLVIGYAKDSPETLRRLADYLERNK